MSDRDPTPPRLRLSDTVAGPADARAADAADAAGGEQVIDGLIEQNRILQGSRMIPSTGTLMDGHHQQVRDALTSFLAQHDVKVARVAAGTKYSESVISEWRRGQYGGDSDKVTRAVNVWMERESRRLATLRPRDYVRTRVAEAMFAIIAEADRRNMMAAIVAPSGTGKSLVLEAVAKDTRGAFLDCRNAAKSPANFIRQLQIAAGGGARAGTRDECLSYLLAYLRGRRSLILIDEAQHLTPEHLTIIRTIFDLAKTPIIMAGTAAIFTAINDRADGGGQFARRCLRFNLESKFGGAASSDGDGGDRAAGARLYTVDEVRRFLDMKRIRLAPEALDYVAKLACISGFGGLGFVETIVDLSGVADAEGIVTLPRLYATLAETYQQDILSIDAAIEDFDAATARAGRTKARVS